MAKFCTAMAKRKEKWLIFLRTLPLTKTTTPKKRKCSMEATNFNITDSVSINFKRGSSGSIQRAIVDYFKSVASTKGNEIFNERFQIEAHCDMSIIMRNTRLFVIELIDHKSGVAYHFDCSYLNGYVGGERNACGITRSLA